MSLLVPHRVRDFTVPFGFNYVTSPLKIIHDAPIGKINPETSHVSKYDGVPIPPELKYITLTEKSLIILRGLSGSGKSFISKYLDALAKDKGLTSVICSSNKYFIDSDTGVYKFEDSKISRAHSECMLTVIKAFNAKTQCIIIDNTHSKSWEFQNYIELAKLFRYTYRVLEINCRNINVLEAFNIRTSYKIPLKALMEMYSRWEKVHSALLIEPAFNVGTEPQYKLILKKYNKKSCWSPKQNIKKDHQYTILQRN